MWPFRSSEGGLLCGENPGTRIGDDAHVARGCLLASAKSTSRPAPTSAARRRSRPRRLDEGHPAGRRLAQPADGGALRQRGRRRGRRRRALLRRGMSGRGSACSGAWSRRRGRSRGACCGGSSARRSPGRCGQHRRGAPAARTWGRAAARPAETAGTTTEGERGRWATCAWAHVAVSASPRRSPFNWRLAPVRSTDAYASVGQGPTPQRRRPVSLN